jgi:epoxyqueuosine reductase
MKCQIVCPYNKTFIGRIEDAGEFTAEETEILLQNPPVEKLPSSIIGKINLLDLEDYTGVMSRNLKVLLEKE